MTLESAETIDVHAHAVLEATMGAAGPHGPILSFDERPKFTVANYELTGVKYRGSPFMDPDLRIQSMDQAGIDFQILSPNPLTYFHFIEVDQGQAFCRTHNDALADLVQNYPERLAAFASLPMQDIGFAIEELERSVRDLGFLGAYIGTDFGMPLNDARLSPFYEKLVDLNVPLFIHPAPAGIDGPLGDANLKQFDLDIIVGFAAQETIAVCTLIYGGILQQYPELDICLSHGGGATGYAYGRMRMAAQKRPWASAELQADGAFDALLHRLWFDTHVHDAASLALLTQHVNAARLVFGTNFSGWDQQDYNIRQEAKPFTHNAQKLLRAGGTT